MAADTPMPLSLATVIERRIESDIFDQTARTGKAFDIANDRSQGKGDQISDAAQAHDL